MNLVHCNPNHRLQRSPFNRNNFFNTVFEDFLPPFAMTDKSANIKRETNLKVDIYEKDQSIFMEAELPGVAKEDIDIDIKGKLITLGGERKSKNEVNENNSYRRERSYGTFERTFSLPFDIKSSTVKAEFKDGILHIEIPQPEEQVKQKVTIN